MNNVFNPKSINSIVTYAKKLKNKTLRQACGAEIEKHEYKGKGNFGQLVEKFYFGYEPNSKAEADFVDVGMELKCTPLKTLKNGNYRSKERLVLNIINYLEVHQEKFETSSFWKKNAHLLLVFYLHDKEKDILDYLIKLVDDWEYPNQDLLIIKRDWETINQKIKFLTLYTFSTENWKRPEKEISFLFTLLENFLSKKIDKLIKNRIKLKIIGSKKKFSIKLQKLLNESEKKTTLNKRLQINLALNYGSKYELLNAIKLVNKNKQKITEKNIENNLYTKGIPNPDLLIRTGNTQRLSNFLLWQLAYTEIFFEKKLWPEFNRNDYKRILDNFKKLKRNFGNI